MKSKILTATQARKDLFKMMEEIAKKQNRVTITIDGKPKVVIMSYEEFEGWQETLEIMSDPQAMNRIRKAEQEYKDDGKTTTWETVKKESNLKI